MPLILKSRITERDTSGTVVARAYKFQLSNGSIMTVGIPPGSLSLTLAEQRAIAVAEARAANRTVQEDALNETIEA